MDADGTSDSSDRQQEIDQVRTGGQELAELVDDDEQMGHRSHLWVFCSKTSVVCDVGGGPCIAQLLLAAGHLSGQRSPSSFDEPGVISEVVHETDDVRQRCEGGEGCASLIVDENH